MKEQRYNPLNINLGFLLESNFGAKRDLEIAFESFDIDEVKLQHLHGAPTATRTSSGIYVNGTLAGEFGGACARCLDIVWVPVEIQFDDLYYFPPSSTPEGEMSVLDGGYIDLAPVVRQMALLDVPIQSFCRENCAGLCPECGINKNSESCKCEVDDIDPRLAALKSLLAEENTDE